MLSIGENGPRTSPKSPYQTLVDRPIEASARLQSATPPFNLQLAWAIAKLAPVELRIVRVPDPS